MRLYDVEYSGNCYKVRLFAALAGLPLGLHPVDLRAGEQRTEAFTKLTPMQQVPVLVDVDVPIWDSQAILIYLARKHHLTHWWPDDAIQQAHVASWLSVAANEIAAGFATARRAVKWNSPDNLQAAHAISATMLPRLDDHVRTRHWFVTNHPTIADCALFPYIALAHEGSIDLQPFPHLQVWLNRVISQPGFVPMSGLKDAY